MAKVVDFDPKIELPKLFVPASNSSGEDNGQITIIGGSSLFHGAPILSLKAASRIVDMVFFASPEPSVGEIANMAKSKLFSFVWVPFEEVSQYIKKSDAVLVGPGFMRYKSETGLDATDSDEVYEFTRSVTGKLLKEFPEKKWVIDAGSLQTMEASWIPENAIVTPNKKEFEMLFGNLTGQEAAKKYDCIVVEKGPVSVISSSSQVVCVQGGNAGLTKGGTGDIQAGITVALLAKNDPMLAATVGAYVIKKAADILFEHVGVHYSADDVANEVSRALYSPQKMQ